MKRGILLTNTLVLDKLWSINQYIDPHPYCNSRTRTVVRSNSQLNGPVEILPWLDLTVYPTHNILIDLLAAVQCSAGRLLVPYINEDTYWYKPSPKHHRKQSAAPPPSFNSTLVIHRHVLVPLGNVLPWGGWLGQKWCLVLCLSFMGSRTSRWKPRPIILYFSQEDISCFIYLTCLWV